MSAVLAAPLVPPLAYAIQDLLLKNRGVLPGRALFELYEETQSEALRTAIEWLQNATLIAVRGNLEEPFGVFRCTLVTR